MRRALGKLDRELSALEAKARSCEDEARRMVKSGNRTRAMQMLRQKKVLERQVVEKDKVYTNMAELIHKVEQAADQKQVGIIAHVDCLKFSPNIKLIFYALFVFVEIVNSFRCLMPTKSACRPSNKR